MRSKSVEAVRCGWSLAGHWFVSISVGSHRDGEVYLACKSKAQAKAITRALSKIAKTTVDNA